MDNDLKSIFDEFNYELSHTTKVFSRTKLRNCPKSRPRRSPFTPLNYAASRSKLANSPSFTDVPFMTTLTPPKSPNTKLKSIEVFSNKRRKTRAELHETAESTTLNDAALIKRSDIVTRMQSLREMMDHDEENEQVLIWSSSEEESEADSDLDSLHSSSQGSHIMAQPFRRRRS